jgi:glycosyltransferase involved in cell wall biosynthesis
MSRPRVSFIGWTTVTGRSAEIAAALGGESRCWYWRWPAPIRYFVAALATIAYLVRRRPRAVVVTNPPVFPALIAWAYGLIARAQVVVDAHPGAFGLKEDRVGTLALPITRWLAPRVAANLVTADELAAQISSWGGEAEILHEAPPLWAVPRDVPAHPGTRALFVGRFAADEPVREVVEAAREVPEVEVRVTGELERAPQDLIESAPPNVRFAGFLDQDAYAAAVSDSDVLIALTTEPTSVMRAAYEAVYARRPLIVSDWPLLRELFPFAIPVANDRRSLADGLRKAAHGKDDLVSVTDTAYELQGARWGIQRERLREILNGERRDPDRRPQATTDQWPATEQRT